MNRVVLKQGTCFIDGKLVIKDIIVDEGVIQSIVDSTNEPGIDCRGMLITPGFIDMHVHLREPGFEHKETIVTGSNAALYGGYTHLVAMANTHPCMDDKETVEDFIKRVQKDAKVHVYTYCAITEKLKGELLVDIETLSKYPIVKGFSDDGRGLQSDDLMLEAMKRIKEHHGLIVAHCEDNNELIHNGSLHDGKKAKELGIPGINSASEYKQVQRDLSLATQVGVDYHICHMSTKESVDALKQYRSMTSKVTGEVTPHHLLLSEDDVTGNSNDKMNPPLRTLEDKEALIKGLKEGVITIIATDHAPHSEEEKSRSIVEAPFGIIGIEFAFSLMYTHLVKTNKVSLETILNAMSVAPAKRLSIEHGIQVGNTANITIIDLDKTWEIKAETLHSKSFNTPFLNQMVSAKVWGVILDGKLFELEEEHETTC